MENKILSRIEDFVLDVLQLIPVINNNRFELTVPDKLYVQIKSEVLDLSYIYGADISSKKREEGITLYVHGNYITIKNGGDGSNEEE